MRGVQVVEAFESGGVDASECGTLEVIFKGFTSRF